jgi:thymidylate kinase
MKKFVAVAGNIGVGKSTLVELLCVRMGWEPFYEPVTENPYLADFYKDMDAWSFHSQIFFLTHRLQSHYKLSQHPTSVVQDRSVYEDAEIFAQNLYLQGHIQKRDYQTYRDLYETTLRFLPPPDLVIYLRASVSTLMKRISSPRPRLRTDHLNRLPAGTQQPLRDMDRQLHALPHPGCPRRRPGFRLAPRSPAPDHPKSGRQADRQGGGCLRSRGNGPGAEIKSSSGFHRNRNHGTSEVPDFFIGIYGF